ncbi:caspase family protein [Streptomyces sp. HUAS MG91]|uniref:Caspase family protein n=1 Tax=Streptomyces tabacisoli TaxID=3156398 RepID=A0AAU8IXZ6_9ACTN
MARHRALLIGASDYEMPGVSPLPFVPADLARLGSVLGDRGFDVLVVAAREGGKQVSRNFVDGQVTGFLRRAGRDDTLLVLLSGHGVHAGGRDFLVPEDIQEDTHPFESGCVAIDWRAHLDETPAARVVFLIDACREGIEQSSMGMAGVRQWGRQKTSAALRRKVAFVYACSPGQYALFVRPRDTSAEPVPGVGPGETFSIFSRSVSDVVAAHRGTGDLDLREFQQSVQDRVTELHRAYRKAGQPQTLRVVTDIPAGDLRFLPPSPAAERPRPDRSTPPAAAPPRSTAPSATRTAMTAFPEPVRHRFRRIVWRRRALVTLLALGVLGAVVWAIVTAVADGRDGGDPTAHGPGSTLSAAPDASASTSAATPSKGSPSPTKSSASPSESPAQPRTTVSGGSTLPGCTPGTTALSVRSVHNSYGPGEQPRMEITAKNRSTADCKIDLGPRKAVLALSKAGEDQPLWSSDDCPEEGRQLLRAPAGDTVTRVVTWDRKPSAADCASSSAGSAPSGTYLAELSATGFPKVQTSFVLRAA